MEYPTYNDAMPRLGSAAFFAISLSAAGLPDQAVTILEKNCFACHSGTARMSGLDLTTREGLVAGGTRGPALGKMISLVRHATAPSMPPGKKLTDADIAVLEQWIAAGAAWPTKKIEARSSTWWSFQKVKPPAAGASIDGYIRAALAQQGLRLAAPAEKATLLRRIYLDLHGLPPTAEQMVAFTRDTRPDAYARVVDELLASPRYGEKWGRHWLDVVRYADTAGFELDSYMLDVWRYRDYVIQSFNSDKPYDRFVREQIAGDELFPDDRAAQAGTGMYCVGPNKDLYPDQADINRDEVLTDFVDTTGAVFLGLTVGCARCHDHKYDPIPQRDYFATRAIFEPAVKARIPTGTNLTTLGWDVSENVREFKLRELGEQITAIQARCRKQFYQTKLATLPPEAQAALETEDQKRTPRMREIASQQEAKVRISDDEVRGCLSPEERERLHAIERRLVQMFANYRPKPFTCGLSDVSREGPVTFLKGQPVKPALLSVLGGSEIAAPPLEANSSLRRKALAEWIASPEHPLTARVMVNRVWQFHFGRGLVATTNDLGLRGGQPTHPELIDYLAAEFVRAGWSVKHLHRLILNSAAYQQSAQRSEEAKAKDPQNLYLSYFSRRRMTSDEIRDSILQAAGTLNLKMGGRPVVVKLSPSELYNLSQKSDDAWVPTAEASEHTRRSIYLLQKRTFRNPMMEVFDTPESMLPCPRRESSTTAPQSLTLLNGNFTLEQARALAAKLAAIPEDREAVAEAWSRVLGRRAATKEEERSLALLAAQKANLGGSREAALTELARALFNLNEFLYVD